MSKVEKKPEYIALAEAIDDLITIDIPGRGFSMKAYAAARKKESTPLVYKAAVDLIEVLGAEKAKPVVIATGATCQRPGLPPEVGELDGPPGAVALARFLGRAFSCVPIIATEVGQGAMLEPVVKAAGMHSLSIEQIAFQAKNAKYVSSVHIMEVPESEAEAEKQASAFIEKYNPGAMIAIEKAGKNQKGVYHNSGGADTSRGKARMEHLFDLAMQKKIITIGIGDGGNEIGMGNIYEELIDIFPKLSKCKCGCGGSIASTTKTSSLVVATVSNWGAYGIIALISHMLGMHEANHTPWLESRILDAAAAAGYVNIDGYCLPEVDGLPKEIHLSIVQLLYAMARWPLVDFGRIGMARNVTLCR